MFLFLKKVFSESKKIILLPCLIGNFVWNLLVLNDDIKLEMYSILFRDLKISSGLHNYFLCFELFKYIILTSGDNKIYKFKFFMDIKVYY
jgi:hypothetical protein